MLNKTVFVLFLTTLISGCEYTLFDPKGPIAVEQTFLLIFSAAVMLILGETFTIFKYFDWQSWLLMIAAAATSVYSETVRFKALKL